MFFEAIENQMIASKPAGVGERYGENPTSSGEWSWRHVDLQLSDSRNVRQYISVIEATNLAKRSHAW